MDESIMDETHLQETTVAADRGDVSMPPDRPRRTTIRTPRHHAPTTLIASLGILIAMSVGIVSTATTNWSRAQSTTTAQSTPAAQSTWADQSADNDASPDNDAADRARAAAGRSTARVREGTRLAHRLGQFTQIGDRLSFTPEGTVVRLIVLENLVLDRVSHVLADTSDTLTWSVSGGVTEFRGANYVILERAVVKRRTSSGPLSDEPLSDEPQSREPQSDGISRS